LLDVRDDDPRRPTYFVCNTGVGSFREFFEILLIDRQTRVSAKLDQVVRREEYRVVARLVLLPSAMKRLAEQIQYNIKAYEEKHGKIEVPEVELRRVPDEMRTERSPGPYG